MVWMQFFLTQGEKLWLHVTTAMVLVNLKMPAALAVDRFSASLVQAAERPLYWV
jgi:hypothetical protein